MDKKEERDRLPDVSTYRPWLVGEIVRSTSPRRAVVEALSCGRQGAVMRLTGHCHAVDSPFLGGQENGVIYMVKEWRRNGEEVVKIW